MTIFLQRQDSLKKDIADFDIDHLKPAEVSEKLSLPTKEEIEFEKSIIEEETAANKETFSKEVVEKLEAFDSNILKHVEKEASSDEDEALKEAYIQEKTHQKVNFESKLISKELPVFQITIRLKDTRILWQNE